MCSHLCAAFALFGTKCHCTGEESIVLTIWSTTLHKMVDCYVCGSCAEAWRRLPGTYIMAQRVNLDALTRRRV